MPGLSGKHLGDAKVMEERAGGGRQGLYSMASSKNSPPFRSQEAASDGPDSGFTVIVSNRGKDVRYKKTGKN